MKVKVINKPPVYSDRQWKERALIVTLSCSKVCRRWRALILNSPSLWGRLIDLDAIATVRLQWKDEIMRRTGLSLLTIKGNVFATKLAQDFFFSTLRDHWSRIQTLEVRMVHGEKIPNHTWNLLSRPAPALQTFRLRSDDGFNYPIPSHPTMGLLFDNNAPLMREFQSRKLHLTFTPEMQWVSHIRRLDIRHSGSAMTINTWLRVLGQMPRIEHLMLSNAFPNPPDTNTSTLLHIPSLRQIIIDSPLRACVVFLAQILPQIGCYLYMVTIWRGESFQPADLQLASQVLSRYSQNFFSGNIITRASLSLIGASSLVTTEPSDSQYSNPDEERFHVHVHCKGLEELPTILTLLEAFSSCNFSQLTTFNFQPDFVTPYSALSMDSNISSFLTLLRSVETVVTFATGLQTLQSFQDTLTAAVNEGDGCPIIFPRLRTVKVVGFSRSKSISEEFLSFLVSRRDYLVPIEVLDMTDWRDFEPLEMFDGIQGLTLITRDEQGIHEHNFM